jgi:hypothetical protein
LIHSIKKNIFLDVRSLNNNDESYSEKFNAKLKFLNQQTAKPKKLNFGKIKELDHDDSEEEFRDQKQSHKIIAVECADSRLEQEIHQLKWNFEKAIRGEKTEKLIKLNESAKKIQQAFRNYKK